MEWNRVTEKQPENGQQVWVNYKFPDCKESHQGYAIWSDGEWFFDVETDGTLMSRSYAIHQGLTVAHVLDWMPLPHPPKDCDAR